MKSAKRRALGDNLIRQSPFPERAGILVTTRTAGCPPKAIADHASPPNEFLALIIAAVLWRDCGHSEASLKKLSLPSDALD